MTDRPGFWSRERLRTVGLFVLVVLTILVFLTVLLRDRIFHTIDSGQVGVQWSRLGGGTITDRYYGEGMHAILPWNTMTKYSVRFQNIEDTFSVMTKDGLAVDTELLIRFRLRPEDVPLVHKTIGPDYVDVLVRPQIASDAREAIARLTPSELYSEKRLEAQNRIAKKLSRRTGVDQESMQGDAGVVVEDRRVPVRDVQVSVLDLQVRGENDEDTDDRKDRERKIRKKATKVFTKNQDTDPAGVEDVLIKLITLPDSLSDSISDKLVQQQKSLEYEFRLQKEAKEKQRKIIESQGIAEFREIAGISILQWKGIEATLDLATSSNAELIFIGSRETGGLPLILGPLAGGEPTWPPPGGSP